MKNTALILALLSLSACALFSSYDRSENPKALSQSEAAYRSSLISDVHYKMEVALDKVGKDYSGKQNISFKLTKPEDLRVDFIDGEILGLVINDKEITLFDYNKNWLTLPKVALKEGANQVQIKFSHPYSRRGSGLHRFEDPIDKSVYLYSDFEPFDANKFAPFFDQPDLKATYQTLVSAPRNWTVISAVFPESVLDKGQKKIWSFPQSEVFSTYIYSLHAGPYRVWKDKYVDKNDGHVIPLEIYTRRTMAKYFKRDVAEWFEVTKQGFEFFEDFFSTKYPYRKYAQIIVPEFNSGAMENVAAVTFNERVIQRSKPSYAARRGRSNTILHEMAHMWFGDLVTMKWWDNLWLNESFATFMAYLALDQNTKFNDAFESFYSGTKQWAYWNDDLTITHPILGEVENTDEAMTSFDGITYGKGASVLKQLYYYLGDENFRKGLKLYFDRHAGKNTVLSDFFAAFEEAAKIDLSSWVDQWLTTAGTNYASVEYACQAGRVTKFEVHQSYKEGYDTYREHKSLVGFFNRKMSKGAINKDSKNKKITLSSTSKITYSGEKTEVEKLIGRPCPDFVFLNYKDFDYAHTIFGDKELEVMKKDLSAIDDHFVRLMSYTSLWQMVRDGKLSIRDYIAIVIPHLEKEKNYNVITKASEGVSGAIGYLDSKEIKDEKLNTQVEDFFWNKMVSSKDLENRRAYYYSYVSVARSLKAMRRLEDLFLGNIKLKGVVMDADKKWGVLRVLASYDYDKAMKYAEKLGRKDKSARGKRSLMGLEVMKKDEALKKQWYAKIIAGKENLSLRELGSVLFSLFPTEQRDLKKKVVTSFYQDLVENMLDKPMRMQRMFVGAFLPVYCDKASSQELSVFIDDHDDLPVGVTKGLKTSLQENDRCINIKY